LLESGADQSVVMDLYSLGPSTVYNVQKQKDQL